VGLGERALKIALAACVLGAAMVVTWALTTLRDGGRPAVVAPDLGRAAGPNVEPAPRYTRAVARTRRPAGRPVGPPQNMPPSQPVFSTGGPTAPAPPPPNQPPRRAEEVAARRVLEPLLARRPGAEMPFVRCLDAGGWTREPDPSGDVGGETSDPLAVPARDPAQAVCRARLRARDAPTLAELLRDASGAYRGHLIATDPREHLDAYLGRWYEADVQLDTEEAYPLPPP
jgi:hypothetical protein